MNYTLNKKDNENKKGSLWSAIRTMIPMLSDQKLKLLLAFIAMIINAGLNLSGPLIVGYTIDTYVTTRNYHGVLMLSGILLAIYILAFAANFIQMRTMGSVGQRLLFKLRNAVFTKLQELPVAFFNQNKAGDLISRLNNDTDRLNQLFSQTLMQFSNNIFIIIGAAVFILIINHRLALMAFIPAIFLVVFAQVISGWVKRKNFISLKAEGALSAEIQESLGNFKVIVAFNRRDYFRERFMAANRENFLTSVIASVGNALYGPIFDFAGNVAQLIVLAYGIYLIIYGQLAVGLLISFLLYINRFYDPLRQMANLWSSAQVALAGWDRINEVLSLTSDITVITAESSNAMTTSSIMELKDVSFGYPEGKQVLSEVSINLEKGKTYALVGPTGGGKTTTASLIARLYDPTAGEILLDGRDIRTYAPSERSKKIGFILQEPFLFTGTIRDNLLYGNDELASLTSEQLVEELKKRGLEQLIERFDQGLDTTVNGDALSLGQRQIIAFMRAVLRNPEILILDEATANIDTVTEALLGKILDKLPKETTRIIIAHRLNTIENADEIFFVNGGTITPAGSMEQAVDMLLHNKRES